LRQRILAIVISGRGFVEMQGGLPLVIDGQVVGAIGASLATPAEDVQVAKLGWPRSAGRG
jgi:glc operon protein GlcG